MSVHRHRQMPCRTVMTCAYVVPFWAAFFAIWWWFVK